MSDWRESLESMADSLDRSRRRINAFNPEASAQSDMGYVQVSVAFRGSVVFEIDESAIDPDSGVNLEAEVVEAFNKAAVRLANISKDGFSELMPGLTNLTKESKWFR